MLVLVCMREEYVRDQQIYVGDRVDNIHDIEVESGWRDICGQIVVATKQAMDVDSAVQEVAKMFECDTDRFIGYPII